MATTSKTTPTKPRQPRTKRTINTSTANELGMFGEGKKTIANGFKSLGELSDLTYTTINTANVAMRGFRAEVYWESIANLMKMGLDESEAVIALGKFESL